MVPVRRPRGPAQNGDAWDGCEGANWKTAQAFGLTSKRTPGLDHPVSRHGVC